MERFLPVYEGSRAEGATGRVREADPRDDGQLGRETPQDRSNRTGTTLTDLEIFKM